MSDREFQYPAIIQHQKGGYCAEMIDFPNVLAWSSSKEEAIRSITESLEHYLFYSGTFGHVENIPECNYQKLELESEKCNDEDLKMEIVFISAIYSE